MTRQAMERGAAGDETTRRRVPGAGGDLENLTAHALRRELHSSRAVPAVITGSIVGAGCVVLLLEALLKVLDEEPLLADLERVAAWLGGLPAAVPAVSLVSGSLVLFLVGLGLFLAAVLPGRRARYSLPNDRAAVVVDAEVLASSLARRARRVAGVGPEQVLVTVGRRSVEVQVRPTSGIPVAAEGVRAAVEDELRLTLGESVPKVDVLIAPTGVVGQ